MNKNRKIRNFALLKVIPFVLALATAIGIGYLVNVIPFVKNLNKSDTVAVIAVIAVITSFLIYVISYKGIVKLDSNRANAGIDAKLMMGLKIVDADISSAEEAKSFLKTKESEFKRAAAEHNAAQRTLRHFEKKAKHLDEIKTV